MDSLWLLTRDFNSFLSPEHKSGLNPTTCSQYCDFLDCFDECNLLNLNHKGPLFTWKHELTQERLDWALGNNLWFSKFLKSFIDHLPRIHSDQHPTLVHLSLENDYPARTLLPRF